MQGRRPGLGVGKTFGGGRREPPMAPRPFEADEFSPLRDHGSDTEAPSDNGNDHRSRTASPGRAEQPPHVPVTAASLPSLSVDQPFNPAALQERAQRQSEQSMFTAPAAAVHGHPPPYDAPAPSAARPLGAEFAEVDARAQALQASTVPRAREVSFANMSGWSSAAGPDASRSSSPITVISSRNASPPSMYDVPARLGHEAARAANVAQPRPGGAAASSSSASGVAVAPDLRSGFLRGRAPTAGSMDDEVRKYSQQRRDSPPKHRSPRSPSRFYADPLTVTDVQVRRQSPSSTRGVQSPTLRAMHRSSRRSPAASDRRQQVQSNVVLTGRAATLEAEVERLEAALRQRDLQVDTLERDNRRLREAVRESELQYTQLVDQFRNCHQSLNAAMAQLQGQSNEVSRLQKALTGEVYDNEALRTGFATLLRNAQNELKSVKGQIELRERAVIYEKYVPERLPNSLPQR